MSQKFQTDEVVINSNGQALKVNPSSWRFNHNVSGEIGLGTGNNEETVGNLTALWQISSQLKAEGSALTDEVKRFNILSDLTQALELKSASRYFNNPEEPAEQLVADNEKLNAMVIQMQEQLQVMQQQIQNPLADAERVKREGDIAIAQGKLQLEAAKLQQDQEQFRVDSAMKAEKQEQDLAAKLTEFELKYNKDISGSIV